MKYRYLAAVVAANLALLSVAHADELDDILAKKELICGVQSSTPPFGFADPKTRTQVGHDVDLCNAIGKKLGVSVQITPLSTDAKVPSIQLGRVNIGIANLAYSKTRGSQIQFSDPYYIARETLVVKEADAGKPLSYFKGKRISAAKGSTSEQAIRLQGAIPLTFQDIGSAYLALMQNKVVGFVCNGMTAQQLINRAEESGIKLVKISEPMALEPIGVGIKNGEPRLLAKINSILVELENDGTLTQDWNKWIGPGTSYNMQRVDKVQPMSALKFEPLP